MRGLRLWGLGALAGLLLPATPVAAEGLCDRLTVPEMLELACTEDLYADRAVVAPVSGTFRALSRMSLRRLDPEADRLAWTDPRAWLEQQMIVDLDGLSGVVSGLADDPDSPFGGEMMRGALAALVDGLEGLSRLPLAACGEGPSETEVACRFGVEPIGLVMQVMLAADGEERFAFNIRTFNEQRLRHFVAIANSFQPE
jgi:hypothetical protein